MSEKTAPPQAASDLREDVKVMFPGTELVIELPDGKIKVDVYPASIRHMKKFAAGIAGAFGVIRSMELTKDGSTEDHVKQILPALLPVVLGDLLDLVNECTVGLDILDLPHWVVAPIAEAWIMESFGSKKKIKPWIDLIENVMEKATGKRTEIWGTLSNLSLGQGTG